MKQKLFLILLGSFSLLGCDSGVLWEDPPYEVHWIDTYSNRTLAYNLGEGSSIGRVEAEVIAVGSNKFYVVAKQRNSSQKTINYFYIDKKKDNNYLNWNETTQGPFNEKEFSELSRKLKLPSFSKVFN